MLVRPLEQMQYQLVLLQLPIPPLLPLMFFDVLRGKKTSVLGFCIGAVVGLVAITPGLALWLFHQVSLLVYLVL